MGKSPLGFAGFYGVRRPLDHFRPETFLGKFSHPAVIQTYGRIVEARWTRWISPELCSAAHLAPGPASADDHLCRRGEIG
jgi:hypothetical protein